MSTAYNDGADMEARENNFKDPSISRQYILRNQNLVFGFVVPSSLKLQQQQNKMMWMSWILLISLSNFFNIEKKTQLAQTVV